MSQPLRIFSSLLAVAILAAMSAGGAHAASTNVKVTAKAVKPLTLKAKQDLDFGQIILSTFTGTRTVSLSAAGVRTCGAGLTCSGITRPAIFNITGSNNMVVRVFAAPSNLINSTDGSNIQFTPSAPATVTLTNSGPQGQDFNVGGSIVVSSATSGGTYVGAIEVTVDYQ